jgi:hypothetical protein
MQSRTERIKELLSQKSAIDTELDGIRQQLKDEKTAFSVGKKERKKRRTKAEMAEALKVVA